MMATITTESIRTVRVSPDQRITLRGISWGTYLRLVEEIGDQHVLKAYNRGVLELMSPGPIHERWKKRLAILIEIVTEELDIPRFSLASTTWNKQAAERGLEADECYMLTAEKVEASGHGSDKAEDYPSPDLAVEVDMSRSAVDRPEIYATLGVPEVWRFDDEVLHIDRLQDDGTYQEVADSLFLPVTPAEVVHWVVEVKVANETDWARQLRQWVRAEVLPRRRPVGP
jgi:Uma2 family endonuclease